MIDPNQMKLPLWDWHPATVKHVRLLALANAADPVSGYRPFRGPYDFDAIWKRSFFYPFKERWLEKYGEPEGWDLQIIRLLCRGCGGSGVWRSEYSDHSDSCDRCYGTGTFRRDAVMLVRWNVAGSVFHCPGERFRAVSLETIEAMSAGARGVIKGLVQHEKVPPAVGLRAFLRLLWIFEREEFYEAVEQIAEDNIRAFRNRLLSPLVSLHRSVRDWLRWSESAWAEGLREWFQEYDDGIPF